ncbi:DUF2778 domain-containing protein [Pantoea sp. LMR881]|uniref:tlde1 domain-containing protein n=1 Tax=Pantoea sp. LMR881 TaxID=3014336 RepID=UPI0022AF1E68|nr:tlde1 domain-containing protein [Pantoea sp. LMR881]MCZ4059569.1 DUF2778 domain-containing protein [Pantoea sp. LMR881]
MAIQGKFIINGAHYSPLSIYGVGTFLAFSGQGSCLNQSGCEHIPNVGPIPAGRYYIVDRSHGSFLTH